MRLTRLHLKDFRGFADLTLDLHPRLTLLVGVNGAGKSSVLDAIAGTIQQAATNAGEPARWTEGNHVRAGAPYCRVDLGVRGGSDEWTYTTLGRAAADPEYDAVYRATDGGTLEGEHVALAYFSAADDLISSGPRSPLLAGSMDARAFRQWFLRWENEENAKRIDENGAYRDPILETFRAAARPFFGDVRVRFNRKRDDLVIVRDGVELSFASLSTGEQLALSLIGEIARLLSQSRPDDPDAAKAELIVLIDEVEQHLHPAWQRKILPTLLAAFPNIQIVATTHSPQVVASVAVEHVVKLRDGQAFHVSEPTEGRDSNTLLEDVFDSPARPPEVEAQIKEIEAGIDADDLVGARAKLEALRAKLGSRDEEVIRLDVHLDASS